MMKIERDFIFFSASEHTSYLTGGITTGYEYVIGDFDMPCAHITLYSIVSTVYEDTVSDFNFTFEGNVQGAPIGSRNS